MKIYSQIICNGERIILVDIEYPQEIVTDKGKGMFKVVEFFQTYQKSEFKQSRIGVESDYHHARGYKDGIGYFLNPEECSKEIEKAKQFMAENHRDDSWDDIQKIWV